MRTAQIMFFQIVIGYNDGLQHENTIHGHFFVPTLLNISRLKGIKIHHSTVFHNVKFVEAPTYLVRRVATREATFKMQLSSCNSNLLPARKAAGINRAQAEQRIRVFFIMNVFFLSPLPDSLI